MNDIKSKIKSVSIQNLKVNMKIVSYSGLGKRYDQINDKTSQWLKINFRGTKTIVKRNAKTLKIPMANIREGDSLLEILDFPATLEKLTIVNSKLRKELASRGFDKFKVRYTPPDKSQRSIRHAESIQRSEKLIQSVRVSDKVRTNASYAVENMIDEFREGKPELTDILETTEQIVKNSLAEAISVISSLKKSDQTYTHCVDVGAIYQNVYEKHLHLRKKKSVFENKKRIILGGFLHDIGKASIPKEILDSSARFSPASKELAIIKEHPLNGAKTLSEMDMPSQFIDLARFHHIKVNPTAANSYPIEYSMKDVPPETRLLSIIDTYQALTGRRSYKKSWPPPAAIRYISALAGSEFDTEACIDFHRIMGDYPVGSLVMLNDGSIGFVVSTDMRDSQNTHVVIKRNKDGDDLEHNDLIDLSVHKELWIKQDLDNYQVFGDKSLDVFTNLKPI